MTVAIRHGLTVPLKGAPEQRIAPAVAVARVGLAGTDHPGLRAALRVAEGERVALGTPLYADRSRPELMFCAPVAGRIEAITLGARRSLASITIAAEGDDRVHFEAGGAGDAEGLKALLLAAGLWPALRARPFERIADPGGTPEAIFVTAIDTAPHAPDPALVLAERGEDFGRGVAALALLTGGPVFVCQGEGPDLAAAGGNVAVIKISGRHPAGLVGTHIARLFTPAEGKPVWHIGYQDVAAIGHLLATGFLDSARTIALSGPGLRNPRLLRVPLGADLHGLARPDLGAGQKLILSGPVLGGRESRYLGRYHIQATVLDRPAPRRRNWLLEALHRVATPAAFIPTQAIEQALGPDIPAVPLLRALSIGDGETAQRLGCLYLAEEDMALATYATGGGTDFGARLRAVLDGLEGGA